MSDVFKTYSDTKDYPFPQYASNINVLHFRKFDLHISLFVRNRPISQTVVMLSIAVNRTKPVCAVVIIEHNYILMCEHKLVLNTLQFVKLYRTDISRDLYPTLTMRLRKIVL